jgi:cytochrome c556
MKFKAILAATMIAGIAFGSVMAADDGTHEMRVEMMKKIAGAAGALGAIAKGDKPYDAAAVKTALTTIAETAKVFPDQFKPGTEKAPDKLASPKIWENMADFQAHAAKLSGDAQMALASLPADPAAVGAALKTIGGDCGACHQSYRLKE